MKKISIFALLYYLQITSIYLDREQKLWATKYILCKSLLVHAQLSYVNGKFKVLTGIRSILITIVKHLKWFRICRRSRARVLHGKHCSVLFYYHTYSTHTRFVRIVFQYLHDRHACSTQYLRPMS